MSGGEVPALADRVQRLELLLRVLTAMSRERDLDTLLHTILVEAKGLCRSEGGTLYLNDDRGFLDFAIVINDALDMDLRRGDAALDDLPTIPLVSPGTRDPNHGNVATYAVHAQASVNIPDAYHEEGFDFSGTRSFDKRNGYRSVSFLTIPLFDADRRVLGILQLINARDPHTGSISAFSAEDQEIVEALAYQAGLVLSNRLLHDAQEQLLESFIKTIADAIDAKSAHTGAHCSRVPILTEMLTRAVCEVEEGPLANFNLSRADWYELRIAAWLHDCGKVTTPVHIIDKATKLETIHDRVSEIRTRFEILRRDAQSRDVERRNRGQAEEESSQQLAKDEAEIEDDLRFLEWANVGREHLDEASQQRVRQIAATSFRVGGLRIPLLSHEEVHNLTTPRGTLTPEERLIINGHMVETIRMLEALPFPSHLKRVPLLAGGHHERMNGLGYPRGIYAGDLPVPARVMAIADVFEALTAQDRPYKDGMALSTAMKIMGEMKRNHHLDPDLFDIFVRSGVYREYATRYLPDRLIDDVDEGSLLEITPPPLELPPVELRRLRFKGFLPEYEHADRQSWHAGDFEL